MGRGGFKARRKMDSDADLTITNGGTGVIAVETERASCWELKSDSQSLDCAGMARRIKNMH